MDCPQCNNPLSEGAHQCEQCTPVPPAPVTLTDIQGRTDVEHLSGGVAAGIYIGVMNVHNTTPSSGEEVRRESAAATPTADGTRPPRIFISYAHEDAKWRDELLKHLKPMMRNDTLAEWNDTQIPAGEQWSDEIEKALKDADVGVLLVTPDFLASDFIFKRELPILLQKKILWIPVSSSSWKETALQHYLSVHDTSRPLASLTRPKRDSAWVEICRKIKAALHHP
jgi:hypothetical protein